MIFDAHEPKHKSRRRGRARSRVESSVVARAHYQEPSPGKISEKYPAS